MANTEADFAEQIMVDLITQGYSGNDLHEQFRKEVNLIRPAIKAMLADTKKAVVEEASRRLLTALEEGAQSAKEKGWIMVDLIKQKYSSDDLRDHFKEEVSHVRLAMEAMRSQKL